MDHHQRLQQYTEEFGVSEIHGVELARLIRMLANIYETILSAHSRQYLDVELSGPRWRLLMHLYMSERRGRASISPTELSRSQNVAKNTISSLLRSLEEQGLIERSLDPTDRRQFQIRLSSSGRELVRASTPDHITFLNQLSADLTAEEIVQLRLLLRKLHISLARHGHLPEPYCLEQTESKE